jgi:hypothetical protein
MIFTIFMFKIPERMKTYGNAAKKANHRFLNRFGHDLKIGASISPFTSFDLLL